MRKTRMPGVFKAPPLPVLFTVRGMVRCDWLSWSIAFCKEGRLAFVVVWEKREKTWQNNTADIAFFIKLQIYFSLLTRYNTDYGKYIYIYIYIYIYLFIFYGIYCVLEPNSSYIYIFTIYKHNDVFFLNICMHVCMCIYIYIYIYIYTYIHTYILYILYIYIICIYIHTHITVLFIMYIYIYICVCVYIYIYIYIYIYNTVHTHILCTQKHFILDAINHCPALNNISQLYFLLHPWWA